MLYEDIHLKRTGAKTISHKDISNTLFQLTNGGKEICTIYTTRLNDSRTDKKKKAGSPMVVVGRLGSCSASRKVAKTRKPKLDTKVQYKENNLLRMCVSSIDGEDYIKTRKPSDRTRSFNVTQITQVKVGRKIYHIS